MDRYKQHAQDAAVENCGPCACILVLSSLHPICLTNKQAKKLVSLLTVSLTRLVKERSKYRIYHLCDVMMTHILSRIPTAT